MPRLRFELAFDGTAYAGWQAQAHGRSVQDLVENRLFALYDNTHINLFGSSRTDSGVHALALPVHFDAPDEPKIPPAGLERALNRVLPPDVRARHVREAEPRFHTRHHALGKTYTYVWNTGALSPFNARYAWHTPKVRDFGAVEQALKMLHGEHDFRSLCCKGSRPVEDFRRIIYNAEIHRYGDLWLISISGNSFLYKMIRSIVGVLHSIATGYYTAEVMETFLRAPERTAAVQTAPPHGLFLVSVYYEMPDWSKTALKLPPYLLL